jgi:hypothetical protein
MLYDQSQNLISIKKYPRFKYPFIWSKLKFNLKKKYQRRESNQELNVYRDHRKNAERL